MSKSTETTKGSAGAARRSIRGPGYESLWMWFSLSYASWLTLPRVLMHEMPDDWQARMAELLKEWDETWDSSEMPDPTVSAKNGNGTFTRWPRWLLDYRRPDRAQINRLRSKPNHSEEPR